MKINKDWITGKSEFLTSRYRNLYGEGNYEKEIEKQQKKIMQRYIIIVVIFVFALIFSIVTTFSAGSMVKTDDNGLMTFVKRPEQNESPAVLNTIVWAISDSGRTSKDTELIIQPKGKNINEEEGLLRNESEEDKLERKINTAIRSLNQNLENKTVQLPTVLDDGTKLIWQKQKNDNYPILLIVCCLTLFMVYRSKYNIVKKEEIIARESVIRELPEFINKMVLLLGAGVVLNMAFERIMKDREKMNEKGTSYFYSQMHEVYKKVKETNGPLHVEIAFFAKRSGVRELMRLSNIITDNVNKGTDLTDKLRREGEVLWFARKKQSEEKGRLAETKLTLPLVILLLVLVMITIAPAMMDI